MVKYCEQCGAKNKGDAVFCESCGVSLPKFVRAAAKGSIKSPEAPSAPVVSEAPARPRGLPRTGIIVLVIVGIVLLIVALVLTGGIRIGGSSPEGVVTEFASSAGSGNFAKVRELSTGAAMATYINTAEAGYNAIKTAYPNASYKIEILSVATISKTDTDVNFYIIDRETFSNAGSYSGVNEYRLNIYLTKVDGEWKISGLVLA